MVQFGRGFRIVLPIRSPVLYAYDVVSPICRPLWIVIELPFYTRAGLFYACFEGKKETNQEPQPQRSPGHPIHPALTDAPRQHFFTDISKANSTKSLTLLHTLHSPLTSIRFHNAQNNTAKPTSPTQMIPLAFPCSPSTY